MPASCRRCRGDSEGNELVGDLRRKERLMLEESALEGLRMHLPGVFGGTCKKTVESVPERIEELREFSVKCGKVRREYKEQLGRD
jgi:hypothetical protein